MSLTNTDLKKIDKLVKASADTLNARMDSDLKKVGKLVRASVDVVNARIDKMEEGMNHRFDENDRQHGILNAKVDRLDKRGDEDIAAAFEDISSIKIRLRKAKI